MKFPQTNKIMPKKTLGRKEGGAADWLEVKELSGKKLRKVHSKEMKQDNKRYGS